MSFNNWKIRSTTFIYIFVLIDLLIFNLPLVSFINQNIDLISYDGIQVLALLIVVIGTITIVFLMAISLISHHLIKPILILVTLINSIALYFMINFNVILDKSMIENILNTKFSESSDFLQFTLFFYVLLFGILPSLLIYKIKSTWVSRKQVLIHLITLMIMAPLCIYLMSGSWLWIDKNAKQLGGKVLPWSYIANTVRYKIEKNKKNKPIVLLPKLTFKNNKKTVVVLVIGETARSENFSLYGYDRVTNPLLKDQEVFVLKNTTSCSTYTTASVKCILSHQNQSNYFSTNYEPLPSYLHRYGVDVIWHSNNWGEPPIITDTYLSAKKLRKNCKSENCEYDEVLLSGVIERIKTSDKKKILVVLHQKGSHGPLYNKRYPKSFETFKPVCESVELNKCTQTELVNAYDNTIGYTDYFLNRLIIKLKTIIDTPTAMLYISDHGESLGEHGLYLHGTPKAIAPNQQTNIPFLIWVSDSFREKGSISLNFDNDSYTHGNIFHSILGAFEAKSDIYNQSLDVF